MLIVVALSTVLAGCTALSTLADATEDPSASAPQVDAPADREARPGPDPLLIGEGVIAAAPIRTPDGVTLGDFAIVRDAEGFGALRRRRCAVHRWRPDHRLV